MTCARCGQGIPHAAAVPSPIGAMHAACAAAPLPAPPYVPPSVWAQIQYRWHSVPTVGAVVYVASEELLEVVGESKTTHVFRAMVGPQREEGYDEKGLVLLVPEPTNTYDPRALSVSWAVGPCDWRRLGYMPSGTAWWFEVALALAMAFRAPVACAAQVRGGFILPNGGGANYGIRVALPDLG